jgi:uncharacterized membrane protein
MITNYIAEIWGISIIITALALLIKPRYLKKLFAEVENEATMLFWGIISVVIGLSMVLAYNVWSKDWQVIITILGWATLLKGLAVLFLPEYLIKWVKKAENAPFLPFALLIALFIGLIITYFGFTAIT